jgi:hypothetical protein
VLGGTAMAGLWRTAIDAMKKRKRYDTLDLQGVPNVTRVDADMRLAVSAVAL